jgi:hypothetical protein
MRTTLAIMFTAIALSAPAVNHAHAASPTERVLDCQRAQTAILDYQSMLRKDLLAAGKLTELAAMNHRVDDVMVILGMSEKLAAGDDEMARKIDCKPELDHMASYVLRGRQ